MTAAGYKMNKQINKWIRNQINKWINKKYINEADLEIFGYIDAVQIRINTYVLQYTFWIIKTKLILFGANTWI